MKIWLDCVATVVVPLETVLLWLLVIVLVFCAVCSRGSRVMRQLSKREKVFVDWVIGTVFMGTLLMGLVWPWMFLMPAGIAVGWVIVVWHFGDARRT